MMHHQMLRIPILELKIECVPESAGNIQDTDCPRLTSCDFDSLGLECKTISNHYPDDTAAAQLGNPTLKTTVLWHSYFCYLTLAIVISQTKIFIKNVISLRGPCVIQLKKHGNWNFKMKTDTLV